ncbi:MAG: hypothetical protein ACPGFB_11100 [Verrucomicrobiales bacterium]
MLSPFHGLLSALVISLLFTSCSELGGGNSMAPVGEGLRFLGISLVVAVLLILIGLPGKGGGRHG